MEPQCAMMDRNKKKEQFNVAYINALAAQAGLNTARADVDDDSVDLLVIGRGFEGSLRNPQIQLQLKCTSQDLISGSQLKFPLSRKNYDDLRGENLVCPRYLVVLVVPSDELMWIEHHSDGMSLRNACYWVSIRHHPDSSNAATVTIEVPLSQRLTTDELRTLMVRASDGESA